MANLESPLVIPTQLAKYDVRLKKKVGFWSVNLHGRIEGAAALKDAGFDAVTLSNNHFLDGGEVSIATTVRELNNIGITPSGVVFGYKDTHRMQTPVIRTLRHGIRLGVLSCVI